MGLLSTCLCVFFAKIIEVSLNTIVTILAVKNKRKIAMVLGFIDVLIWFIVIREALSINDNGLWLALSFALGHAIGTYLGTILSNTLINSKILMQVITDHISNEMLDDIRNNGYAISKIDCYGKYNSKKTMLFIELDSKKLNELQNIIKNIDSNAFIVINETKNVINGFFK